MKLLKRITALMLVLTLLCTSAFAVPEKAFEGYSQSPAMQYQRIRQMESLLTHYHLDSGRNDSPMLRAYQSLTGTTESLSENELRTALMSYFRGNDANYTKFAKEMCSQFDAYTAYMSMEEYNAAFPDSGDYEGIGVTVRAFGGTFLITDVHEGSAAYAAGLAVNDRIVKIGDDDLRLLDYSESTALMTEAVKAPCSITVRTYESGEEITVELTPAPIDIPNVEYEMRADGVGYMKINQFSSIEFVSQINNAEDFFAENNAKKVILDLRDNPGGDLTLLLVAINFFIPDADVPLFDILSRGETMTYTSTGRGIDCEEIAVLVNASSASSAEICAGALSDAGYATIFGTTTYGKARGQTSLQLIDESLLHMSMSEVSLPIRGRYHGNGVEPDVVSEQKTISVLSHDDLTDLGAVDASSDATDIRKLQRCLYALGYLGVYTPGAYDQATVDALQAYLEAIGDEPADVCSAETMAGIAVRCKAYLDAHFTEDTQLADALAYLTKA